MMTLHSKRAKETLLWATLIMKLPIDFKDLLGSSSQRVEYVVVGGPAGRRLADGETFGRGQA
jgi:hypothetical protein